MNKDILLSFNTQIIVNNANSANGCVVAVGGFDGLHLGHMSLIESLVKESKKLSLPAAVFTFNYDDSPKNTSQMLFQPGSLWSLLLDNGVDILLSAPFSKIKNISAENFVSQLLYKGLNAKSIICGYDFRFGYNRAGDASLIRNLLSDKGVSVITQDALLIDQTPVSATRIRTLISQGDIKNANRLLGRELSFVGPILHGAKLGRTLGFPTINQEYPSTMAKPPYGVYVVKVRLSGKTYFGVANFGIKPTVASSSAPVCETYIFDYDGDCYGKVARLYFLDFIRPEQRFSSLEQLKQQVESDKSTALTILSKGEYI